MLALRERLLALAVSSLISIATPSFATAQEKNVPIPSEERQALEALYKATDGDHWTHRVGWLGPRGTECSWHGVTCVPNDDSANSVVWLSLGENNLTGTIPNEIGRLRKVHSLDLSGNNLTGALPQTLEQLQALEWLELFGNHFSGMVPGALIDKWLAGQLDISAEPALLTDVSEIDLQSSSPALLCATDRIVLHADNTAIFYSERCRKSTPDDRTTFCEVKEGQIERGEFARLAWMIERNGFFRLKASYSRSVTHSIFEDTRVTKGGITRTVSDYAGAGPFRLWMIERAIKGVAASADWTNTRTQQKCPPQ